MNMSLDRSRGRHSLGVLFADDFDLPPAVTATEPEPEVIIPSFSAADIASAREAGWAEGYESGVAEAARGDAAAARAAAEAVAASLADAREVARTLTERSAEAIAQLLLACLASTFPVLCARHGDAEIQAILHLVLPALTQESAITVRVNPHAAAGLAQELTSVDAELAERVKLIPTDAMTPGDVRITWRNGVAQRDTALLWRQVADVLLPAGMLLPDAAMRELQDAAG